MDQPELLITFLGSFLTAFFAALAIIAIEKWWTEKSEFLDCIRGLITEIDINTSRLGELKDTTSSYLSEFEKIRKTGGIMNLPPVILLHEAFDYCRIKGFFSKLPEDLRVKINDLYELSDMVTTFVDRDFQISICSLQHPDQIYINKKRTWEALLAIIEEYQKRKQEINFKEYWNSRLKFLSLHV